MNTSLEMMFLTEDTMNEFVFQAWRPLDFVGLHHTRPVPILVLVGNSYQAELQTHIQDDNLFNQCTPSRSLDVQPDWYGCTTPEGLRLG